MMVIFGSQIFGFWLNCMWIENVSKYQISVEKCLRDNFAYKIYLNQLFEIWTDLVVIF